MKYSFDSLNFLYEKAHGGAQPIHFSRVAEFSKDFRFNFLDFVRIPVSSSIGEHTHLKSNQELYVIISGVGEMTVNGEKYLIGTGDVIVNPIGGTHGLVNTGDEEIFLIVVETQVFIDE